MDISHKGQGYNFSSSNFSYSSEMVSVEVLWIVCSCASLGSVLLAAVHVCHLLTGGGFLWLLVLSDAKETREPKGNPLLWINLHYDKNTHTAVTNLLVNSIQGSVKTGMGLALRECNAYW